MSGRPGMAGVRVVYGRACRLVADVGPMNRGRIGGLIIHSGVAVRPSGMSCTGAGIRLRGSAGRVYACRSHSGQAAAAPGIPPSAGPVACRSGRAWRDSPAGPIEGRGGAEYLAEAGQAPPPGCRGMGGQAMRNRAPALGVALLLGVTAGLLGLSASASGSAASALAVRPKPSPSPSPSPAPSGTFVKAYTALVNGSQLNLTPLDVQATSDGGYVALAETQSAAGLGVDWLVKLSAAGVPQWQEQVGCASAQGGPGDYAYGVSVQQTTDGGYIAAGSFTGPNQYTGALILKLDSAGNVQWQKDLGPTSTTAAYFNSVQQTADGGYVAAGAYYTPTSGPAPTQVLAVRFGPDGSLTWQHAFATL